MTPNANEVRAVIDGAVAAFAREVRRGLTDPQLREVAMSGPAIGFATLWKDHPSYRNLAMALTHDDAIRSLLKHEGKQAPVIFALIAGTELMALQLPAGILAGCLFEQLLENVTWTGDSIRGGLQRNIDRLRQIAKGRKIETTWAAGFAGFRLSPEMTIETELGRFSDPAGRADLFSDPLTRASVVVTAPLAHHIPVHHPGAKPPRGSDEAALTEAVGRSTLVKMAVIMAAGRQTLVVPIHTQQTLAEPHLGWMGFIRPPGGGASLMSTAALLDSEESRGLVQWAELLAKGYPSIQVALDRLAAAVTERSRPADMLIDAVTSWESLFGTTPETTFRLTAALSLFLESGYARRIARRKELDRIYQIRSRVVHGESVEAELVHRMSEAAIEVAKATVRRIFVDHPWLLSLRSSRERADAILLGDPRLVDRVNGNAAKEQPSGGLDQ